MAGLEMALHFYELGKSRVPPHKKRDEEKGDTP